MLKMTATLIAVASLWYVCQAYGDSEIYYTDLNNPPRQFIIYEKGISIGDILLPVEFCSPSIDFYCFSSGGLRFAVPKQINGKRSWIFDNVAYNVKRQEQFLLLGQPVEVMFIEQISEGEKLSFIFSKDRGLLGFSLSGETRPFFILEDRCGFGSDPLCQSSQLKKFRFHSVTDRVK